MVGLINVVVLGVLMFVILWMGFDLKRYIYLLFLVWVIILLFLLLLVNIVLLGVILKWIDY